MKTELAMHLDAFVAAAEEASFSAAARRLGLTPAAVSKSVARLESGLGVRLFQRSTRSLSLTAEGQRLHHQVCAPWAEVADALADVSQSAGKPAGTLKVAMALAVGREYFVPMLADFLEDYPDIVPDLYFENRQVDLVAEGFDVAIGGGIELMDGLVARELSQVRIVLAASPAYLAGHAAPARPSELGRHRGLLRRSLGSGKLYPWALKNDAGEQIVANVRPVAVFDDPEAMARAAVCGMGVAMLPMPHAYPLLANGKLVRILPDWYALTRPLSIYYSSRKLMPAKVRVFVEHVVQRFSELDYGRRFTGQEQRLTKR
jgi:DNA-binding transcriptional LysR family regulator